MKRTYLIVLEKGTDSWSAFAPDVADTGGVGGTVDEARQSLREGIGYMLDDLNARGLALPEAISTSVDFSEFDPSPAESHYEIEWMTVDLPPVRSHTDGLSQQAA